MANGKRSIRYDQAIYLASFHGKTPDEMFYDDFMRDEIIKKNIKKNSERSVRISC